MLLNIIYLPLHTRHPIHSNYRVEKSNSLHFLCAAVCSRAVFPQGLNGQCNTSAPRAALYAENAYKKTAGFRTCGWRRSIYVKLFRIRPVDRSKDKYSHHQNRKQYPKIQNSHRISGINIHINNQAKKPCSYC